MTHFTKIMFFLNENDTFRRENDWEIRFLAKSCLFLFLTLMFRQTHCWRFFPYHFTTTKKTYSKKSFSNFPFNSGSNFRNLDLLYARLLRSLAAMMQKTKNTLALSKRPCSPRSPSTGASGRERLF